MNAPAHFETLRTALSDWVDADVASYCLASCLGIVATEDGSFDGFRDAKWVFCSGNPTGDALYGFMDRMVELGFLEFDSEGIRYRWNPAARTNWYDNGGMLPNTSFERTRER